MKRDEFDRLGTELWNLSTRLRRDEPANKNIAQNNKAQNTSIVCRLRAFAFLLLDSAGSQAVKGRERRACIRLMKVALKAAKVCVLGEELESATKVLERAATYEDLLSSETRDTDAGGEELDITKRLRLEYFSVRTALVGLHNRPISAPLTRNCQAFRQDRIDTAEHFFAKCKQLNSASCPEIAENLAELLYEIGKHALVKRNHEVAVRWLERACDVLGEQDLGMLSPEAGELRLCILQSLGKSVLYSIRATLTDFAVQAHMTLKTAEGTDRAWHLVKLMEADYGEKMVVPLLKIELLSASEHIDENEYYNGKLLTDYMTWTNQGSAESNDLDHRTQ